MQRLWILLLAGLLAGTLAAEENVNPGINRHYQDPDFTQWQGVFERDGREIWDRRREILNALKLRKGERVADIGAGTGFFSLMMAQAVGPGGKVYAVDIARNFVAATLKRAEAAGLDNVIGVVNDQHSVNLPENSVDLVFISDTYHHFEYPQSTLKSLHAALRESGELVVIDFRRVPGESGAWVMGHVRSGEQAVIKEIEAAGFGLTERLDFMHSQYFLRFRRR